MEKKTIQASLFDYFNDVASFTLEEANKKVNEVKQGKVKEPSIRARIYEGIDSGLFERISKGVYKVTKGESSCLLIQGDGRTLSFLDDESIDAIVTDHPYLDKKSHSGGNRNFTSDYSCFQYTNEDFIEKCRVLKNGGFLVEFLPEENANNYEYLFQIKQMAKTAGFEYYTKVVWTKGSFVANTGRKSKNSEDVMMFSKGKARELRIDVKKNKQNLGELHYMSGAKGMLPKTFDFQPPKQTDKVHQAEKPIKLLEQIIDFVSLEGEVVLDQFAGSFNVGKASLNKKRNAILIEQNKVVFQKSFNQLCEEYPMVEHMKNEFQITNIVDCVFEWNKAIENQPGDYRQFLMDDLSKGLFQIENGEKKECTDENALEYINDTLTDDFHLQISLFEQKSEENLEI